MSGLSLKDIASHGHLRRWHTARVRREQTLGEHVGLVAMIALELGMRLGMSQGALGCLIVAALCHDAPEIEFGDIPTPGKRFLNETLDADIDRHSERAFWRAREVQPPLQSWYQEYDLGMEILRHADLLEAWLFYRQDGLDPQKMAAIQAQLEEAQAKLSPALKEASIALLDQYLREVA